MSNTKNDFLDNLDDLSPNAAQIQDDSETEVGEEKRDILLQFRVTASELKRIEKAIKKGDFADRSHFCRSSIGDKLTTLGMF